MKNKPDIAFGWIVLDCDDVNGLAEFYSRLLGWEKSDDESDEWADVTAPSGMKIAFQKNEGYVRPVWPEEPDKQMIMAHLDFTVENNEQLTLAVDHAITCGAVKASVQYDEESYITMLDPAGHPFCFVVM